MNCACKWTNSIDAEADHASSSESELEGEKSEELVSLETSDDEGRRVVLAQKEQNHQMVKAG